VSICVHLCPSVSICVHLCPSCPCFFHLLVTNPVGPIYGTCKLIELFPLLQVGFAGTGPRRRFGPVETVGRGQWPMVVQRHVH
jgi:hypothetical protein